MNVCCIQAVTTALAQVDREKIYQWINELSSPETRENALLELSKKRESVPDLAPMLWHSCGTIAALLQVSCAKKGNILAKHYRLPYYLFACIPVIRKL